MAWNCHLHPQRPLVPRPGDLWFDHAVLYNDESATLSMQYRAGWALHRNPMRVRLPNGEDFLLDRRFRQSTPMGWIISGRPPFITATPAISSEVGIGYFGYLLNGVLGDDEYGRTY